MNLFNSVIVLNSITGCTAVATTSVLSNSSLPTLSVAATGSVITCSSPTLSLNATSSSTGSIVWSTPTGTASNPVIVGVSGNYTVSVTDAVSGCTNSVVISVSGTTVAFTNNSTNIFLYGFVYNCRTFYTMDKVTKLL